MLLKARFAGSASVARLIPRDRKAEGAMGSEAWRIQESAGRAYLIALVQVFSLRRVRECSQTPRLWWKRTFLAHWSIREERLPHDP